MKTFQLFFSTDREITKFQACDCPLVLKFASLNSGFSTSSFFQPFLPFKRNKRDKREERKGQTVMSSRPKPCVTRPQADMGNLLATLPNSCK